MAKVRKQLGKINNMVDSVINDGCKKIVQLLVQPLTYLGSVLNPFWRIFPHPKLSPFSLLIQFPKGWLKCFLMGFTQWVTIHLGIRRTAQGFRCKNWKLNSGRKRNQKSKALLWSKRKSLWKWPGKPDFLLSLISCVVLIKNLRLPFPLVVNPEKEDIRVLDPHKMRL